MMALGNIKGEGTMDTRTDQQYPKLNEVFELTLDGDASENTPIGMVKAFGYNPDGWPHNGQVVEGTQAKRFKLVQNGYQPNWEAVKKALEEYGPTPEGQWMKAFKDAYPTPDGKGCVGIADASWVSPLGFVCFPFVGADGEPGFRFSAVVIYVRWRWLVPADEVTTIVGFRVS